MNTMHRDRSRKPGPTTSATILVVDDDPAFLRFMDRLLSDEGYTVRLAATDAHPYEQIKAELPDLIILDLLMPTNGWQVLGLLLLDPATCQLPVLICTADTRSLQPHQALIAGHRVDILTKPFDIDHLLAKVRQALAPAPHK